jgi:hypothetical protein
MVGHEWPLSLTVVVLPDRALCLPTFGHLLIVNKPSFPSSSFLLLLQRVVPTDRRSFVACQQPPLLLLFLLPLPLLMPAWERMSSKQAGHLRVYPHVLQHELASGFPFEFYYLMIFLVYRDLIDSRIKL